MGKRIRIRIGNPDQDPGMPKFSPIGLEASLGAVMSFYRG
jgi:hypothetical protein